MAKNKKTESHFTTAWIKLLIFVIFLVTWAAFSMWFTGSYKDQFYVVWTLVRWGVVLFVVPFIVHFVIFMGGGYALGLCFTKAVYTLLQGSTKSLRIRFWVVSGRILIGVGTVLYFLGFLIPLLR